MEGFTPFLSSVGGLLIGLAAIALLLINGRIAGISGIADGVLHPEKNDTLWRVVFLGGLLTGAVAVRWLLPEAMAIRIDVPLYAVLLGGFLVGIGTRIGNGCTSGHGVCGVGRLAPRSLAASAVFFTTAVVTSLLLRHVLGPL
ncbi:MAG TPA: YeeE/YedE thiosulfate transporter family protein [Gammaproteobacteria bacterium]